MRRDASADKRDYDVDTKAMVGFAKKLFDRSWMERIYSDLEVMNGGKVGHPYVYTDAMIIWAVTIKIALGTSFRMAEGILNSFLDERGYSNISHSRFVARCNELMAPKQPGRRDIDDRILAFGACDVAPKGNPITVAIDSTGMSLSKCGSWLSYKWHKKIVTGWIKLHVAVDVETNEILAYAITDEKMGDVSCLGLLMEQVMGKGHEVGSLLADAAYDKKAVWKKYDDAGIHVAININSSQLGKYMPDRPSRIRAYGCAVRAKHMKRIMTVGRDQWKLEVGYNMRWKVECTFSDLKRLFGDVLRARTRLTDMAEVFHKVRVLNIYKGIRESVKAHV